MDTEKKAVAKKPEKLTELQEAFCREYVVDYTAGRAYQRAQEFCGRRTSTDNAADQEGCRTLGIPKVRNRCNELRDAKKISMEDGRERVLDELIRLAFSDARKIARWVVSSCAHCWESNDPRISATNQDAINRDCTWCRGRGEGHIHMTPSDQLKDGEARLFDSIEETKHGIKINMQSRAKAIETLAKYYGITMERVEITGKNGGPIEIVGARDRLLASLARRRNP